MPRVKYNVEMVSQQYSPVCWYACTAMLIQFKRRTSISSIDLGLPESEDFRGPITVPSYGSRFYAIMRRLGLTNARSSEVMVRPKVASQEMIYQQLRRHGPFLLHHYCGSFWYGPGVNVPTTGAHTVLVVGTDTNRGCVWFNNPWGTRDIPTTTASIVGAINRWEQNRASKSISYM